MSVILYLNHGEDFWRGIRDGGRKHRRQQMYRFLAQHKDRRGIPAHDRELNHIYDVCLKTAKELSRTKSYETA